MHKKYIIKMQKCDSCECKTGQYPLQESLKQATYIEYYDKKYDFMIKSKISH